MSLVAYGSTVIGVAGLMKDAYQLYKSLKDAFSSTTISKRDLRAAEAIFENYPLEYWDEQLFVETILEIDINHLEEFVEELKYKFNLGHEVDAFKQLKYRLAHQVMVQKISYKQDFTMKYGQIAMIREGNKFSCAIAFNNVNFKLKDEYISGCIWNTYLPVDLNAVEVNLIKNTFLPHEALKSFKKEGLVERIKYEEGW